MDQGAPLRALGEVSSGMRKWHLQIQPTIASKPKQTLSDLPEGWTEYKTAPDAKTGQVKTYFQSEASTSGMDRKRLIRLSGGRVAWVHGCMGGRAGGWVAAAAGCDHVMMTSAWRPTSLRVHKATNQTTWKSGGYVVGRERPICP